MTSAHANWSERLIQGLVVAFLVITTVLLDVPGKLFFFNTVEFSFQYGQLAPVLIRYALVVSVIGTMTFVLLPGRVFRNTLLIVFGLAVSLWIQGNLFKDKTLVLHLQTLLTNRVVELAGYPWMSSGALSAFIPS